jgi:cell division transport system ATP-binding protein
MGEQVDTLPERRRLRVRLSGASAGFGRTTVLRGIDFEAWSGEVALVTGATATGKSALIHMLRLALRPRGGEAEILGEDVAKLRGAKLAFAKRRIGYVAENPAFIERASAFENIALPLRIAGRKSADYADDVRALISYVGLNTAADEPVYRLSMAERRRAAIARALAAKPELVLADAPTAGLSPDAAYKIVRLLAEMRRVGAAVVITSQDEGVASGVESAHWRLALGRLTPATAMAEAAE